jgi:glycosyltransferase involved in cell wall biosynthesis
MAELISVVIPCYNQAQYLGEAIVSALEQRYRPREVVVVDDGATDSTFEVATAFAEVRCVRQDNQGLSAARNTGLRTSRGGYLVFLDADDRLLPHALEVGAAALEAHPDAAFAVGRHRRIAEDGSPLPVLTRPRVEREHYASLVRRCWIVMPATVLYRRTALEVVGGFDPRLRCAEDYDLYLRLARWFPIVDHHAEVAEYRQHEGTISGHAERMLPATLAVLRPHRPGPRATAAHRLAWRERDNAVWYYDRLLERACTEASRGHWPAAARAMLLFVRHLPRHPVYAWRRLGTPLRWARRQIGGRAAAA